MCTCTAGWLLANYLSNMRRDHPAPKVTERGLRGRLDRRFRQRLARALPRGQWFRVVGVAQDHHKELPPVVVGRPPRRSSGPSASSRRRAPQGAVASAQSHGAACVVECGRTCGGRGPRSVTMRPQCSAVLVRRREGASSSSRDGSVKCHARRSAARTDAPSVVATPWRAGTLIPCGAIVGPCGLSGSHDPRPATTWALATQTVAALYRYGHRMGCKSGRWRAQLVVVPD